MWEKEYLDYTKDLIQYSMGVDTATNEYTTYMKIDPKITGISKEYFGNDVSEYKPATMSDTEFDELLARFTKEYAKYNNTNLFEEKPKLGMLNIKNLNKITEVDKNIRMSILADYPGEYHIEVSGGMVIDPVTYEMKKLSGTMKLGRTPNDGKYFMHGEGVDGKTLKETISIETISNINLFIQMIWEFASKLYRK